MTPRIRRVNGPLVEIEHLGDVAMDDLVTIGPAAVPAEIVGLRDGVATAQAYEYTGGIAPGDGVEPQGRPLSARLGPGLLGGVFDGLLRPLAGAGPFLTGRAPGTGDAPPQRVWNPRVEPGAEVVPGNVLGVLGAGPVEHRLLVPPGISGTVECVAPAGVHSEDDVLVRVMNPASGAVAIGPVELWPVRRPRPFRSRCAAQAPLQTGQRVLDLLFPVPRGGSAAVPGGFGTGKTVLLQQIAKWCDADVIVYVGCGERGNEMAEVVTELAELDDPRTGGKVLERTVVLANTSNMPLMARETSIHTGMTVAEYFRDMGHDVVVIADSTSRWAEAMREFSSRAGALPAEEGYPADLASALASFYERAGVVDTLGGGTASITVLGAVSPPGGDLSEPVTVFTERVVRCRWSLDRDLAHARHYPAVSWSGSFSRDVATIAEHHAREGDDAWAGRRTRLAALLADADRLTALAELVGVAALPGRERVTLLAGRLARDAVLQQNALSPNDGRSSTVKTAALADAVLAVADALVAAVAAGADSAVLEGTDFGPLVRARDDADPDDSTLVRTRLGEVLHRISGGPG